MRGRLLSQSTVGVSGFPEDSRCCVDQNTCSKFRYMLEPIRDEVNLLVLFHKLRKTMGDGFNLDKELNRNCQLSPWDLVWSAIDGRLPGQNYLLDDPPTRKPGALHQYEKGSPLGGMLLVGAQPIEI